MSIHHDQAILLACVSCDLKHNIETSSRLCMSRTEPGIYCPEREFPDLLPVLEREGERESLPFGRLPNGTPFRPPVLDAVFVTHEPR